MNLEQSIPEELVPSVLEKASRLYQGQAQSDDYSLAELMAAGSEVSLPPELIQQAYEQIQQEQIAEVQQRAQQQKQLKIGGAIAAATLLLGGLWVGGVHNSLSSQQTTVESKWAQVENQMQRRADLIPQLTQVAQAYADRESDVMRSLSNAREGFLTANTVTEQQAADEAMKRAISDFQIFAASSNELQSSELFINLQYEIAGTENRIATERMRYNEAVASYNQSVQRFPNGLVAGALGFEAQSFSEQAN
ncbi:MAG: LemA family protein [Cyanobacteria bacterium J06634_5]